MVTSASSVARYVGLDISLNHGAAVCLNAFGQAGNVNARFFSTTKKVVQQDSSRGYLLPLLKSVEHDTLALDRLNSIRRWLVRTLDFFQPTFVGLEGYAFSRANQAHQLGEVGGLIRLTLYNDGYTFRIHDPASVKLFASGKGDATKEEVAEGALRLWNFDAAAHFGALGKDTLGDLTDAYVISRMVATEAELRRAEVKLSDLPEPQIRVFNRTTKSHPENILARDWTRRPTEF